MKKFLSIIFIIFFSCQSCFAGEMVSGEDSFVDDVQQDVELNGYVEYDEEPQETIYLEEQPESVENTVYLKVPTSNSKDSIVKTGLPEKLGSKSLSSSTKNQMLTKRLNQLRAASKFSAQEYDINPVSATYSGRSGNLTYGTTYDSSLGSAQLNYSTGVFTRYDGRHFALTTSYSKNTKSGYDGYSDKMFFAPELKISKRLSLLDIMQTDISRTNQQNELVLRYKAPVKKYADDVMFEFGAAQSFYQSNYVNSSIKFSTRFKL